MIVFGQLLAKSKQKTMFAESASLKIRNLPFYARCV